MWYGPPATVSPAARVYVALTPSAAKKLPLPVVKGDGSASPYVLLLLFVVQVAGLALIANDPPAFVPKGLDYAEAYYQKGFAALVVYQPQEAILNLWGQNNIPTLGPAVHYVDLTVPGISHTGVWRLYARSDRYYVKRFEDETNLRCHLVLDTSRSMGYRSGPYSKSEYALFAMSPSGASQYVRS